VQVSPLSEAFSTGLCLRTPTIPTGLEQIGELQISQIRSFETICITSR